MANILSLLGPKSRYFWVWPIQKLVGFRETEKEFSDLRLKAIVGIVTGCKNTDMKEAFIAEISLETDTVNVTINMLKEGVESGAIDCFGFFVPSSSVIVI